MSSFDIKVEKANALRRYRRLRKITSLFRFLELFVFTIMMAKLSTQLPQVLRKVSTEYFRGISVTVFSQPFVFVLGNAIILVLFLKYGRESGGSNSKVDYYDEYVKNCVKSSESLVIPREERKISRSQSENMIGQKNEKSRQKLRRSATDRRVKSFDSEERHEEENSYKEDELSNEEFRRTVEAFIAKQQKSLRDEEFSPIVHVGE